MDDKRGYQHQALTVCTLGGAQVGKTSLTAAMTKGGVSNRLNADRRGRHRITTAVSPPDWRRRGSRLSRGRL